MTLSIPITSMLPDQVLNPGSGASLQVLSADPRETDLLLEWENFRMLSSPGLDFGGLDSLQFNSAMRNFSTVLLPESCFAPLNAVELIDFLDPQLAVLSVAIADKAGLPSPDSIQAFHG